MPPKDGQNPPNLPGEPEKPGPARPPTATAATSRAREDWPEAFLEAFASLGNVTAAARIAGTSRSTVWRRRLQDEAFAARYEEALQEAADTVEQEIYRRAVTGWNEPVFYQGELVGHIRKYDGQLLHKLAGALRPEKWRERFDVRSHVTIENEGELDKMIQQDIEEVARLMASGAHDSPQEPRSALPEGESTAGG